MKKNFTVFYSWQSDLPDSNKVIAKSIEGAIKELAQISEFDYQISLDRDTKDASGSPDITKTIFNKIKVTDIFICEVTSINNLPEYNLRKTPNPNVLIELGFATFALGWDRIICINNLKYSTEQMLPFDIRNHRVLRFNSDDQNAKQDLKGKIKHAINTIIKDYDNILSRQEQDNYILHDREIYQKINNILPEVHLKDSLSLVCSSSYCNGWYYDMWSTLIEYSKRADNRFINEDLHILFKTFTESLDDFNMLTMKYLNGEGKGEHLSDYEERGIKVTEDIKFDVLQSQRYFARKEPFPNQTWDEYQQYYDKMKEEFIESAERVKAAYEGFRLEVKKKLGL